MAGAQCVGSIGKEKVRTESTMDEGVFIELEGKGRGTPREPYLGISYPKDRHHGTGGEGGSH